MKGLNIRLRPALLLLFYISVFTTAIYFGSNFKFPGYLPSFLILILFIFRWWLLSLINSLFWQKYLSRRQVSVHWMETFHTSLLHIIGRSFSLSGDEILTRIKARYHSLWGIPLSFPEVKSFWNLKEWLLLSSLSLTFFSLIQYPNHLGLYLVFIFLLAHFFRSVRRIDKNTVQRCFPLESWTFKLVFILDTVLFSFVFLHYEIDLLLVLIFFVLHFLLKYLLPFDGGGAREVLFLILATSFLSSQNLNLEIQLLYNLSLCSSMGVLMGTASGILFLRFYRNQKKYVSQVHSGSPPISIIIPTYNEEKELEETVERIKESSLTQIEILIVDGGSCDRTKEIALRLGCKVYESERSRGAQMRLGSEKAQFDILLFCHADTLVEKGFDSAIIRCFKDPNVAWGGFWKRFKNPHWMMYGSRFRCWIRWMLSQRAFGDQLIFVRRKSLIAVGGFPLVPLMEEFELAKSFKKYQCGHLGLADCNVFTSTRKYKKLGVIRTYWRMALVTILYHMGYPLDKIEKIYRKN